MKIIKLKGAPNMCTPNYVRGNTSPATKKMTLEMHT